MERFRDAWGRRGGFLKVTMGVAVVKVDIIPTTTRTLYRVIMAARTANWWDFPSILEAG